MDMKSEELAYMAGLFDGEGSIYIGKASSHRQQLYSVCLSITNTDKDVLQWAVEHFGGAVSLKPAERAHYKTRYLWRAQAIRNTAIVLEQILPFLKIKKQQALLALRFLKLQIGKNRKRPRYNLEELELLSAYCNEMHILNKRGSRL